MRHFIGKFPHLGMLTAIAVASNFATSCTYNRSFSFLNTQSENNDNPFDQHKSKYDVVLNFSGKGTAVVWDMGVLKGLLPTIKPLHNGRTIFAGNSGGSMMAAYFSCFGLHEKSLQTAIESFSNLDRSQIPEENKAKVFRLARGKRSESYAGYLESFARNMLTVDGNGCVPTHPMIIVASNGDVVENRLDNGGGPLIKPHPGDKQMRDGTYDVHAVGTDRPQHDVSDVNLIGKACTYFADEKAAAILEKVPERERQCDLRLIKTADDLVFAVMASVAEPTYFYPVADLDPNDSNVQLSRAYMDAATDPFWRERTPDAADILESLASRHTSVRDITPKRFFAGGFLMSTPAQDLRRALPHLHVIGTGRRALSRAANSLLRAFFLVDTNKMWQTNRWWIDLEVQPSKSEEKLSNDKSASSDEVMDLAEDAALRCLKTSAPHERPTCAPVEDLDELDPDFSYLVVKPNKEFRTTIDGSPITEGSRQLPASWLKGLD
jgi:hypothetical protein